MAIVPHLRHRQLVSFERYFVVDKDTICYNDWHWLEMDTQVWWISRDSDNEVSDSQRLFYDPEECGKNGVMCNLGMMNIEF